MFILFITRAEKKYKNFNVGSANVLKARLDDATRKTELFIRTYTGKYIAVLSSILSLSCSESREKYHCFVFGSTFMLALKPVIIKVKNMILTTLIIFI